MAYTIVKSDGTFLTTIADGTMNVTSTSLGLPGRNYAGYGQPQDTNFVHLVENFAASTVPANPLRGQLWYDTVNDTLNVCPADGETRAASWLTLTSTAGGGATTFGSVTVTGNLTANNITALNNITAKNFIGENIDISGWANLANANIGFAEVGTLVSRDIRTHRSDPTVEGTMTGRWTFSGPAGNVVTVLGGNIATPGIRTNNYMNADGSPLVLSGTYTNGNVFDYMTGSNAITQFSGNIAPTKVTTTHLAGGGTIDGIWTLSIGARMNATYADLAERFSADAPYEAGTVVEIGGDEEVTAVVDDLSEVVFGVVSSTAAYLMNSSAGNDATHPAIALSGRLKVKVIGTVKKGDRLVSAGEGRARAAKPGEATAFNTIGRALIDKEDEDIGTVESIVNIR